MAQHYSNSAIGRKVTVRPADELVFILSNGMYSLISAGANPGCPDDLARDPYDLVQRYCRPRTELEPRGFAGIEEPGRYGEPEFSSLVLATESDQAGMLALGRQCGQESIITGSGGGPAMVWTPDSFWAGGSGSRTAVPWGLRYSGRGYTGISSGPDSSAEIRTGDDGVPYRFTPCFDIGTFNPVAGGRP